MATQDTFWDRDLKAASSAAPTSKERKDAADIAQSGASAAASGATAARTTALTPLEKEKLAEEIRAARIANDEAERKAKAGPAPTEEKTKQVARLANLDAAVEAINLLTKGFNENLAGQGLVRSTLEYFPSQAKGAINSTGAGLADVGLSLFKVPGSGAQSDKDAERFVKANQPSSSDFDATYLAKLYNLRRRLDANVRAEGLPPIKWTEPSDEAARQFFEIPEAERNKLAPREVGTLKDVPPELAPSEITRTPPEMSAMNQPTTAAPMPQGAAFDAKQTSKRIPPAMQAEMNEWFASRPRGTVGLEEYANVRSALDAKYGFGKTDYVNDPKTKEFLDSYNDPKRPTTTVIPPITQEDTRSTMGRVAGSAIMNPVGTAVATGVSGVGLNALDALSPDMAYLRELNPGSAMLGDVAGSIAGGSAVKALGQKAAEKLFAQYAPRVYSGLTSTRRGAPLARNALTDITQGATYGAAVEGDGVAGAEAGLTGTLAGGATGRLASLARRFGLRGATRDPAAQELVERYGVQDLTVPQQLGGMARSVEDAATSVPGIGEIINARRGEGIVDMNRAAFREVAGQDVGIGNAAEAALAQLRRAAYDAATAGRQFDLNDPGFVTAMQNALAVRSTLTDEFAAKFDRAIQNSLAGTPIADAGQMTGDAYQQAMRKLTSYKPPSGTGFEQDFREGLSGVQDALTGAVRQQAPDVVPALREADTMYRGEKILEDAVNRARKDPSGMGTDVFMPGMLTDAVYQSGRKYPGDVPLDRFSSLAQRVMPSRLPDSGTARRAALTALGTVGLGGAAGLGLGFDPEEGASLEDVATGAGIPAAVLAALAAGGSRGGQRALSRAMFSRPQFSQNLEGLIQRYAPDVRVAAPTVSRLAMPETEERPYRSPEAAPVVEAAPVAEAAPEVITLNNRKFVIDRAKGTATDVESGEVIDLKEPAVPMAHGGLAYRVGGN